MHWLTYFTFTNSTGDCFIMNEWSKSVSHFNGRSVNAHTFDINDDQLLDPFFSVISWVAFATWSDKQAKISVEKPDCGDTDGLVEDGPTPLVIIIIIS